MLKTELIYSDGTSEEFSDCLGLTLRKSLDTPAHSLELTMPFSVSKEVCEVRVSDEVGMIFEGIADEQTLSFSQREVTKLSARSMEALLLDNEACPEVFKNPSSALVFARYGKVCSLRDFLAPSRSLKGVLKVYKGMSCYQVLKEFCQRVYGKTPFVSGRNLCIEPLKNSSEITFCDKGEGVVCSKIERTLSRYRLISKVLVKTASDGAYNREIYDEESVASGVCRQRFTDVSGADAVSFSNVYKSLEDARRKSVSAVVYADGRLSDLTGASAKVLVKGREYKGLLVSDILYTLKNGKEQTKITLVKQEG